MKGSARDQARLLAIARIALGTTVMLAPGAARRWIGPDAESPGARLLTRIVGGRDVALGLGALLSLNKGTTARGWLEAGAFADAVDTVATLLALRSIKGAGRYVSLVVSAVGAGAGTALAPKVDQIVTVLSA